MMDAGFAGFLPVADMYGTSTGAVRGSNGQSARDAGFSDTLSSVARQNTPKEQEASESPTPQQAAAKPDQEAPKAPPSPKGETNHQTENDATPAAGQQADDDSAVDDQAAAAEDAASSAKAANEKHKENHGKIVSEQARQLDVPAEQRKSAKDDETTETQVDADADDATDGKTETSPKSTDADVKSILALLTSSASSTAIAAAAKDPSSGKSTAVQDIGKHKDADVKSAIEDAAGNLKSDAKGSASRQADKTAGGDATNVVPGLSDNDSSSTEAKSDGPGLTGLAAARNARQSSGQTSTGNAEVGMNVEVLDSRRFLGFTQNTNSSSVLKALTGDQSWTSAMQTSSAADVKTESGIAASKVVNTLKIQMHPIDLGAVTATMRLVGEQLVVDLKVESSHAYRQLKDDQANMVNALRSQGYAVDQISVSMAATSDKAGTSTGQDTSQGQGSAQQQQAGQSGAGGSGQGGRSGSQSGFAGDQQHPADDNIPGGIATGTQGNRSGQVYL